jgi:two-component system, NarL family, nitrate/nitrite response regulator NarL
VVSGDTQIRVLVAAQTPIYRDGLRRALDARREFRVVGDAVRGDEALRRIRRLEPDVAIVSVSLPDLDAGALIRTIGRERLGTRLVMVSAEPLDAAFAEGPVAAHIPTNADPAVVCDAVATAARGEIKPFRGVWSPQPPASDDVQRPLSSRERAVLELMAEGRGAAAIGRDLHVSEATVKTHLQHIYRKLGVSNRAAAVAEGMRRGLIA